MADEKPQAGTSSDPVTLPDVDKLSEAEINRQLVANARAATEKEQNMTLLQGIKLYPKAVGWSFLISTCIIMEGYDVSLLNKYVEAPLQQADASY